MVFKQAEARDEQVRHEFTAKKPAPSLQSAQHVGEVNRALSSLERDLLMVTSN